MKNSEIWLAARELEGWAEAGGVKDVVRDQAEAFGRLGWTCRVVLPLYGFLKDRVVGGGRLVWRGISAHASAVPVEAWQVQEDGFEAVFLDTPSFADKASPYTYTAADEAAEPQHVKGQGFADTWRVNLEFQWAAVSFWASCAPRLVLAHDGHAGFLPAIARMGPFGSAFAGTSFGVIIHNAGQGYRQEMPATPDTEACLGLPEEEVRGARLDGLLDPFVSASRHAKLITVSENYADELNTGRNDSWSGPFGAWLRTREPLQGITNGISLRDKDPRDGIRSGLPAAFDPLSGGLAGKRLCRGALERAVSGLRADVHGGFTRWDGVLYVMQGRLTAQKGIDALADVIERALGENVPALFLVMGQGERRYEERLRGLARDPRNGGRFLFLNTYDEAAARLVFAAGDFFLVPSVYEPCGLTDLKAQLMATLPIVHRVGGLVKVLDGVTGFSYDDVEGLWGAFQRSAELWRTNPSAVAEMRRRAFARVLNDFDWTKILAERYLPWLTGGRPVPILSVPRQLSSGVEQRTCNA